MRLVPNTGTDCVIDELRRALATRDSALDLATPELSLFAFALTRELLANVGAARLALPRDFLDGGLLGGVADRERRNELQARTLARQLSDWIGATAEIRLASRRIPQGFWAMRHGPEIVAALSGGCEFTTSGLGRAPAESFGITQAAESDAERAGLASWFEQLWRSLGDGADGRSTLKVALEVIATAHPPSSGEELTTVPRRDCEPCLTQRRTARTSSPARAQWSGAGGIRASDASAPKAVRSCVRAVLSGTAGAR